MSYALFIQHRTLPGRRDEAARVWSRHMKAGVGDNLDHLAYSYCFGRDAGTICAFQHDRDEMTTRAFLETPACAAHL